MKINAVRALFRPAQNDTVALFKIAVFYDVEPTVRAPNDARVHAALFGKPPLPA